MKYKSSWESKPTNSLELSGFSKKKKQKIIIQYHRFAFSAPCLCCGNLTLKFLLLVKILFNNISKIALGKSFTDFVALLNANRFIWNYEGKILKYIGASSLRQLYFTIHSISVPGTQHIRSTNICYITEWTLRQRRDSYGWKNLVFIWENPKLTVKPPELPPHENLFLFYLQCKSEILITHFS